jgi:hypothetical protein
MIGSQHAEAADAAEEHVGEISGWAGMEITARS